MFGIMNEDGKIIWMGGLRDLCIRLAGTRTLAGTPVRRVFGEWLPIGA